MVNSCQRIRVTLLCLSVFILSGCATTTNMAQLNRLQLHAPIKVLVIEAPVSIDPGRLKAVLTPDIKAESPASDELISQGQKHAQKYAMASMEAALSKQDQFEVVTPLADESRTPYKIRETSFETPITQDEADWIQRTTGANALLRFRITDYGMTPISWRNGYITFEVTSTLAIAGIIAFSGSTAAKAVAGTYLVQEAVEESAEAYAGFWALNVVSRPVRIEAELISLNPVTMVWEDYDTGLSDVKLSRLIRNVATHEVYNQLDQSTDYAVKDVITNLSATLLNNIKAPGIYSTSMTKAN